MRKIAVAHSRSLWFHIRGQVEHQMRSVKSRPDDVSVGHISRSVATPSKLRDCWTTGVTKSALGEGQDRSISGSLVRVTLCTQPIRVFRILAGRDCFLLSPYASHRRCDCRAALTLASGATQRGMGLGPLTLFVAFLSVRCDGVPFFQEVDSPALLELVPPPLSLFGGAWLDVDGDGDLDFAMGGDPADGVFVRWLENNGDGDFAARTLDNAVMDLPGQSVRQRARASPRHSLNLSFCTSLQWRRCRRARWQWLWGVEGLWAAHLSEHRTTQQSKTCQCYVQHPLRNLVPVCLPSCGTSSRTNDNRV